eukprot:symbB.v1.2.006643.t1/scaffold394.1/size213099/8
MQVGQDDKEDTFTNPIIPGDYPDPGANKIGDHFYLVATGGGPKGAFRILRSADLVHWEKCGQVFGPENLPSWSGGAYGEQCDYWAPEIHQLPGCVAVFFSAREPSNVGRALHIGVATAERPEGPYTDSGGPLISDPHWAIDASYFHDDATGKQYVLWKVDGNAHKVPSCIKMRELDATGTKLAAHGRADMALIHSELKWEGGVVEGPFLVKRGGFYYLFYSGDCYGNYKYCVAVARAENVTGPYIKSGAPILSSGTGWAGPGHCAVLDAGQGHDVMIFHAWPSDSPGGRGEKGKGRAVLMEREEGWPVVGAGVPSTMPQSSLLDPSTARSVGGGYVPRPPLMVHQSYVLQVSQGWDLYLGDKTLTKAMEAFTVHPGLVPGGTVSLRCGEKFLRHRCGKLELSPFDASELFAHDASWMALPGLTDAGLSHVTLRSVNFPEMYVRHKNQELFIDKFEMNETYLADATWIADPAQKSRSREKIPKPEGFGSIMWSNHYTRSNNVQRNIVVHQQQNDPNFAGPKKPQGYRVSQSPGGPTSINLSWNEAPTRAASPGGNRMRPEAMVPAGRAPSPGGSRFEVGGARGASPAREAGIFPGAAGGARAASPAARFEAPMPLGAMNGNAMPAANTRPSGEQVHGAAGLAAPPAQRHPCYGDPQVGFAAAQPRYGDAQAHAARHPTYSDPQAVPAGAKAQAPQSRHPCYGDPQLLRDAPAKRTPSPGGRSRAEVAPGMAAAGFQAQNRDRGGGAPYAYDGLGGGGGLPPPLPRQVQEPPFGRDQPFGREQPRVSSNAYACGGNQNCGNVITDRRSTRVSHPPGGGSSICTAIGQGNHRTFMLLVVVELTVQWLHFAMIVIFLRKAVTKDTFFEYISHTVMQYPFMVFVMMLHFFSSPGIAFLLANHLYLVGVNMTTNEMVNCYRYEHFWQVTNGRKVFKNPFHKGILMNCMEFWWYQDHDLVSFQTGLWWCVFSAILAFATSSRQCPRCPSASVMSAKKSVASRASRVSAFSAGPERFTSRRAQLPRTSFSVDVVVQERFKKMIRFKRVMAAYGLLNSDNSNEGAGKPSTVLVVVGMFRKPLKGLP